MMRRLLVLLVSFSGICTAVLAKDQSRLPFDVAQQTTTGTQSGETPPPLPVPEGTAPASGPQTLPYTVEQAAPDAATPPVAPAEQAPAPQADQPQGEDLTQPDPSQPDAGASDGTSPDELSLGEIPEIQTMELTVDIARRSIDSYTLVKTKYESADLESYENLQDFVDQSPEGKNFEADIKAAGFANVTDWNLAITSLGFAYTGVTDDQSADINQQISEIEGDAELAQDMKDRMIASLRAMIPSDNNKTVVQELMKEPAYVEKLKQLDIEEE